LYEPSIRPWQPSVLWETLPCAAVEAPHRRGERHVVQVLPDIRRLPAQQSRQNPSELYWLLMPAPGLPLYSDSKHAGTGMSIEQRQGGKQAQVADWHATSDASIKPVWPVE